MARPIQQKSFTERFFNLGTSYSLLGIFIVALALGFAFLTLKNFQDTRTRAATTFETTQTPCSQATLATDALSSTIQAGTIVYFTAHAQCSGTAEYAWFVGTGSGEAINWQQTIQYGADNTYTWNTAGLAPGIYHIKYWVENMGEPNSSFDADSTATFTIQ